MQTKSSYRVLKWTLLVGTAASMATACVVTSGTVDTSDGGEGGNTTTAGKTSTGGNATAGKTSTGGSSAGTTSTAGKTSTAGSTSDGGAGSDYVPGLCEVDHPTPTMVPSCSPDPERDKDNPCKVCMKAKACDAWQTCFGDTPTTACGWGATADAPGQFDCIHDCYLDTHMPGDEVEMTLGDCEGMCLNQCEDKDTDGFALTDTQALLGEAQDNCLAECFP